MWRNLVVPDPEAKPQRLSQKVAGRTIQKNCSFLFEGKYLLPLVVEIIK